jgi:hypothetical protein
VAETLRFDVLGKGDASDLERLASAVDRFADRLKALDRVKANPEVDLDTKKATRQVGAFAENLKRRIGRAIDSLPDIELDADSSDADRAISEIRGSLAALSDKEIGVDIDTETARRQVVDLERRLRELSDVDIDVALRADVESALGELRRATGEVDRLDGRKASIKVDVDRGLGDSIVQVAALGRALKTLAIPAAAVAAAPTIAAIGSAAVTAVGAVGVLPGVLLAAGAAAATLKVGLSGVGDALKNLDDAKKFGEALAKLAPAAQEFAVAVRDIAPAWKSVRLDTQQALFAGLGAEMQKLSAAYLPSIRAGLGGFAGELNALAKDFVTFATQARTVENVDAIFRNTTSALEAARPAAQNLAAAFLDIGVVGSELLPGLSSELTAATGRFRTFIDQARRSGELQQWMQAGIDTVKQLGSITANTGRTLLNVFSAQKAAGVELLGTLDRLTEASAAWTASAEGQRVLVDIFSEIRATIDAVQPGLQALAVSALQAVAAFANTGALQAAGQAFTAIAQAVAPLLPVLAELAGGVVNTLAASFSAVAAAVGPIVSALSGLLGALGPIPAAVIAMVLAFKGLATVGAAIAGLGTSLAGMATKVGASETATTRLTSVFRALGTAVPIAGAALVGLVALYDQVASKATESAKAVADGSMSMQQAIAQEVTQLQNRNAAYQAAHVEGQELASAQGALAEATTGVADQQSLLAEATRTVEAAYQEYRSTLTPFAALQADVARAQGELNDAVAQFGASSPQATSAADRLRTADEALKTAQEGAADAAKTHADRINELSGAMQSQIGSALAYEEAVQRTADAHKEANDALKQGGADSEEYKARVLDLAQAQEQQAQAASRAVEAQLQGADASVVASAKLNAYNLELLKLNDGSAAGQAAFVKLASGLSQTGLDALSAAAKMTGLKTEILTLPDGRTVTVVTSADTASIDTYKQQLDALVAQQWVGTVTVVGDPTRVNDTLNQVVTFANGQTGTITLNGNSQPVQALIGQTKYNIDATTGVLTIDGNPAPGEADLSGLKLKIDQTTGTITLEGNPAPVDAAKAQAEQPSTSDHTINPQTGAVDGAKTNAQAPTASDHTINPQTGAVDGARATVQAPTSSTHTINVDAGPVNAAKIAAQGASASIHTINVDAGPVQQAVQAAQVATSSMHTLNCDDKAVVDAKGRAEQATNSMHTINCNDSAVRSAKAAAQRATSSTHTIHVRVVGAPVPRAAGGYATPRAEGAYAAPMAAGGMRRMSAARAEIVPPRQPRLIGDRMQGDEAFIPINRSARSESILNTAANRMGFDLVPHGGTSPDAVLSSMRAAASQRPATHGGGLATALRELNANLRALEHPREGATVNNNFYTDLRHAADDVAKTTRRQAALGIFE